MNDQNRYRGGSQRNPNGQGSSSWNREEQSPLLERGNSSRQRFQSRDDRSQYSGQRDELSFRSSSDEDYDDGGAAEQDRDYRGGGSGYGRSRDYQGEWSGFGSQSSAGERERGADRYRGEGGSGSPYGSSSPSSGFSSGARSGYGSYGPISGSAGSRSSSGSPGYGSPGYGSPGYGSRGYGSPGYGSQGYQASRYSAGGGATSYSGRGPKGYLRSDERIREDVCERLSDNDEVDASDIEVQVQGRTVTLTGTVENRRMKHIAEDIAEAVSGVEDVDNRVTVRKPLLKDIADRITGNEGEQHYANTGTKNGPSSGSSLSSSSSLSSGSSGVSGSSTAGSGGVGANGRP